MDLAIATAGQEDSLGSTTRTVWSSWGAGPDQPRIERTELPRFLWGAGRLGAVCLMHWTQS
jgi:hypothetical protein